MSRQGVDWELMYKALAGYSKQFGHCGVPANWKKNPQLGRWVAMQRYRRKLGEVTPAQIERLDKLGFVWSPTDRTWNAMFERLLAYRKKNGTCDVPSQWGRDLNLANWVANQRHRHKMGQLAPARVKRLDEIGFVWSVYGKVKTRKARVGAAPEKETKVAEKAPEIEERLYHIAGEYIQYNGTGPRPPRLEKCVQQRGGEFPPYIPLPHRPLFFKVHGENGRELKVKWSGRGALPEDVRHYLNEHGALPPHD